MLGSGRRFRSGPAQLCEELRASFCRAVHPAMQRTGINPSGNVSHWRDSQSHTQLSRTGRPSAHIPISTRLKQLASATRGWTVEYGLQGSSRPSANLALRLQPPNNHAGDGELTLDEQGCNFSGLPRSFRISSYWLSTGRFFSLLATRYAGEGGLSYYCCLLPGHRHEVPTVGFLPSP